MLKSHPLGMGKSTVSKQFKRLGFPVFDADAAVHEMYSKGGKAVPLLRKRFPGVFYESFISHIFYFSLFPSV